MSTGKKVLAWIAFGFVALVVLGALLGDPDEKGATTTEDAAEPSTPQATPTATPVPTVNVTFNGPYTVRTDTVTLRGDVEPLDATVKVAGSRAKVRNGRWTSTVAIKHRGENTYRIVATQKGFERDSTRADVTRKESGAEREVRRAREEQARIDREAAARASFMGAATTIPYNQLAKDPEDYKGEKVVYRGQIFQIQEEGSFTWMLLAVTDMGYDFWDDNIYIEYDGEIAGAEDDIITVYGTVRGTKSYETQIGGETFVPEVRAKYIE
jgi:hypothetical protein